MSFTIKKMSRRVAIFLTMIVAMSTTAFAAENAAQKNMNKMPIALVDPGLKAGNKAPNFALKNAFGETVELNKALENGPVVLIFYRGAWCPYCNIHLHELKKNLPEFEKYGAQVIAISPQLPDRSAKQVKKEGFPFEVLSDETYQVLKDYQLYFELPKEKIAAYKKRGFNLEDHNGKGRIGLPTPGAFIIDRQGIIRTMQAEVDFKTRMSSAAIAAALAEL